MSLDKTVEDLYTPFNLPQTNVNRTHLPSQDSSPIQEKPMDDIEQEPKGMNLVQMVVNY